MQVALITDFGEKDYFVGILKGVIRKINPGAAVIDLCHGIPSFYIPAAAFVLEKSHAYFPRGTVFLTVVDPGVGTDRKILIVSNEIHHFIGPDNGVLTPVLQSPGRKTVREVEVEDYFLRSGASTFEARDKMAPIAAHLSMGLEPQELGRETKEYVVDEEYLPKSLSHTRVQGRVQYIDKFGNVITNILGKWLFNLLLATEFKQFSLTVGGHTIEEYRKNYAAAHDRPFLLIGSHGNLEIARNQESAFRSLEVKLNQQVFVDFL